MMQVAVKRWIRFIAATQRITRTQLEVISRVPLLHAEDYELLLHQSGELRQGWGHQVS